nr:HAD family acid phosphatase [Mycoplasma phocoeninasale]
MDYAALKQADGKVSNPADRKFVPVVFMDIDETVFINEYTQAWTITDNNGQFSETKKDSIDAIGNRKPIPGAIEFIKHVFEAGGIVMFNSGIRQLRPSIDGIKKNLIAAGLDAKYVHD